MFLTGNAVFPYFYHFLERSGAGMNVILVIAAVGVILFIIHELVQKKNS